MSVITTRQRGAGLIEVMVALFILAVGLLGYLGLQTEGMSLGRQAYMNSQAAFLAQDMAERLVANTGVVNAYTTNFGDAVNAPNNCASQLANCTPNQLATWDREQWLANVAASLPAGLGAVAINPIGNGLREVTISIQYQLALGRNNPGQAPAAGNTYTYVLVTQI